MNYPQNQDLRQLRPKLYEWARGHRRALGLAGASVAAGMTAVWLAVVPAKAAETSGIQEIVIRWGHPACWAFLALVGVLVATNAPKRARDAAGIAAAACYAAFIAGMLF